MENDFSGIFCVADMNITGAMDRCLADLEIPEVFVQRAKQISLADSRGFLGLRPATRLEESRALLYRFHVPSEYAEGVTRRIAETTDLRMGGRGSVFARRIELRQGAPAVFNTEKLERLCGKSGGPFREDYVLITCIVPRGSGDSLARAVLELGISVPVVFFGSGVGMRDKLGILRITIPVEKEIIWFVVPRRDSELVEKTLIPRARLDIPGQGFLYKFFIHAPVVNLRVRQGKRIHAATMEQVIAALDEVQGSSDWRRLGSSGKSGDSDNGALKTRGLFFIGDEEEVETFRLTAMKNGARGATLNSLEMRSYSALEQGQSRESRSRELCDIVISPSLEEKLREPLTGTGLFDAGKTCALKTFDVEMPSVIRPGPSGA